MCEVLCDDADLPEMVSESEEKSNHDKALVINVENLERQVNLCEMAKYLEREDINRT